MPINIQDYLLGRIPVGRKIDIPAYLMTKAASGGVQEISGTLPLTVRSRASQVLQNYIIYGTASGAGVETENLFDVSNILANKYITTTDAIGNSSVSSVSNYCYVYELRQVTLSFSGSLQNIAPRSYCFYDSSKTLLETGDQYLVTNATTTFDVPSGAVYMRFTIDNGMADVMLNAGRTALPYELYGYKLPITVTSNGTTTDYPLYIGDSQLGEEEYVDYEEQKIYKLVDGTLTPTDPPVPLPDIALSQATVTIDIEGELKPQATVKGRIEQIT